MFKLAAKPAWSVLLCVSSASCYKVFLKPSSRPLQKNAPNVHPLIFCIQTYYIEVSFFCPLTSYIHLKGPPTSSENMYSSFSFASSRLGVAYVGIRKPRKGWRTSSVFERAARNSSGPHHSLEILLLIYLCGSKQTNLVTAYLLKTKTNPVAWLTGAPFFFCLASRSYPKKRTSLITFHRHPNKKRKKLKPKDYIQKKHPKNLTL